MICRTDFKTTQVKENNWDNLYGDDDGIFAEGGFTSQPSVTAVLRSGTVATSSSARRSPKGKPTEEELQRN